MLHDTQAIMFCNGLSSRSNIEHMSIKKVKIVYEKIVIITLYLV